MYKCIMIISILLSLSNCKQHTKILDSEIKVSTPITYQEKPFVMKWKIEKDSFTKIPLNINKKIKNICKNHNSVVLIKIKTYADDTAMGTFDCRI